MGRPRPQLIGCEGETSQPNGTGERDEDAELLNDSELGCGLLCKGLLALEECWGCVGAGECVAVAVEARHLIDQQGAFVGRQDEPLAPCRNGFDREGELLNNRAHLEGVVHGR